MDLKRVIKNLDFSISEKEFKSIKEETKKIVNMLKKNIKNKKIKADVFLGGSFAKGTLTKSNEYDIDIFIRFDLKTKDIAKELEKSVLILKKEYKLERVHGSRDYFKAWKDKKITFEIIPVLKIKRIKEAKNVTDLSYFHVNYVKKNLDKKKIKELQLTKRFFKANGAYGAESYIQGFSGYSLECLIIYYKTFENLLRRLSKIKKGEQIVIDSENKYKNKKEILLELNESKTQSPIILVDPTWKDRNALAALSKETFEKFQEIAKKFLKKPSEKYFEKKEIDIGKIKNEAKKKKDEFLKIEIYTNRQEGDIAGTKLKKFANYLEKELSKYYNIRKSEFIYNQNKKAEIYMIAESRKEIVKNGPPVKMEKAVEAFKKANKSVFIKNKRYYSIEKVKYDARTFLNNWSKDNKKVMLDMGIIRMKID